MLPVTIRLLDGAERGRVFEELETPITIGREEGNTIQLNDERVSRYHLKIQEDHDKLVLTDLESTNGTKVNGEDIQLRILRHGDLVTVGRSVLLVGSRAEIAERLSRMRGNGTGNGKGKKEKPVDSDSNIDQGADRAESLEFELNWPNNEELQATLHRLEPPDLPDRMSPGQAAQLCELLEYLHIRFRHLLDAVRVDGSSEDISLDLRQWQEVIDLQARLAEYLREIGEPRAE